MLVLFLASAAVLIRLECSRFGLVNGAIRQSELLAETLGVNVPRYKLGAFVLGAFFAGVAGVFFAHSQRVLHSSDFGLEPMVLLVVFTVIGGDGSVWGPVVGVLFVDIVPAMMRAMLHDAVLPGWAGGAARAGGPPPRLGAGEGRDVHPGGRRCSLNCGRSASGSAVCRLWLRSR
jgi:ABC-type branched-subunit amino acid transport system permease subunit